MKKRIATAAMAAVTAAVLAGCSSTTSAPAAPSAAPTDLTATISYAFWDENQKPAVDSMIKAFNEEYPNITVNEVVTPFAQYWMTLQTEASSNTLPDVFWMNMPYFKLYASNGQLAPIDSMVDDGRIDLKAYPDDLTSFYSWDGSQYAVPKDVDTIGMWVDKKLFEEAGVELPTDGWTWDEYHQKAKAISDALKAKGDYGTVFATVGQATYYNTVFQAGGKIISDDGKTSGWDTPEAQAGLQLWADIVKDGSSPTIQQMTDTSVLDWFMSGKAAMIPIMEGASVALFSSSKNAADFTVVPLPKDKEQANVGHALANVVSATSKNTEAAQAFQTFLASQRAQQIQSDSGVAMSAYQGTQQGFVESHPEYDLQVFVDAIAYAKPYPASVNTDAWANAEYAILPKAFSGEITVADAAKQLADQMNAALAKE